MTTVVTLNYKILDEQYDVLRKLILKKTSEEFSSFKHPYIENYKYSVKIKAKEGLLISKFSIN